MSRFLNAADVACPEVEHLEIMLARLPDAWLICRDRWIPGADGQAIAFLLLHPEVGVALVDLAPAPAASAAAALSRSLEGVGVFRVPVVAVPIAPDEISKLGERLSAAFESACPCEPDDPDWQLKAIDLLLSAEDAPMLPVPAVTAATVLAESGAEPWRHSTGAKALMLLCAIVAVDIVVAGLAAQLAPAAKEVPATVTMQDPNSASVGRLASAAPAADRAPDTSHVTAAMTPPPAVDPLPSATPNGNSDLQPAPRVEKHAVRRHRPREPLHQHWGNNPRAGRFYDENDAWLDPFGRPLPGAPVLRTGGG
jgi:hypothetical protein